MFGILIKEFIINIELHRNKSTATNILESREIARRVKKNASDFKEIISKMIKTASLSWNNFFISWFIYLLWLILLDLFYGVSNKFIFISYYLGCFFTVYCAIVQEFTFYESLH